MSNLFNPGTEIVALKRLAADFTTSLATMQDTNLQWDAKANTVYLFDIGYFWDNVNASVGPAVAINGPAGAVLTAGFNFIDQAGAGIAFATSTLDQGTAEHQDQLGANDKVGRAFGTISIGATAGPVVFRIRSTTASTNVTLLTGSSLKVFKGENV